MVVCKMEWGTKCDKWIATEIRATCTIGGGQCVVPLKCSSAVDRPRSDDKCASAGEDYCVTGESGEQCQSICYC